MIDYTITLLALKKLTKEYEQAMLLSNPNKAFEIGSDLVEVTLTLQDLAYENQKV